MEFARSAGKKWPSPVPEKFNVLFVGAITHGKNIELLVRVFGRLHREDATAKLTIVGDGDHRSNLESLVQELGLNNSINFVGHVSDGIARYFYDATVMVMPGLGGLAVSDALSHGVPVICGVGDGSEMNLIDGSNGRVLSPLDEESLFSTLSELRSNNSLQKKWRENASKIVVEKYNITNYVSVIADCIRKVARK
jgi:glycosyltransferase involved in cell wall biosynthesis